MRVRHLHAIDLPSGSFVLSFVALPSARAVAVLGSSEGRLSFASIDARERTIVPLDESLVHGAMDPPRASSRVALARVGEGFALVTDLGATRWKRFGAEPTRHRRTDPFPQNAHGFRVGISNGGISDDPNAALMLLHEPQQIDAATRYALLRFDDATATARWEWLQPNGEPPGLDRNDFPIPDHWRASSHLDDVRPFLDHGAYVGGRLLLFALGGLNANFARWGMDYSVAVRVEAGRPTPLWQAPESCWGRWSSSGRFLLARPLRPKGPMKGITHLLDADDLSLHRLELPRGFGKHRALDHDDGIVWLTNDPSPTPRLDAFVAEESGA